MSFIKALIRVTASSLLSSERISLEKLRLRNRKTEHQEWVYPKDGDEAEIFAAAFDDFAQRFERFILTPFHVCLADVPDIAAQ